MRRIERIEPPSFFTIELQNKYCDEYKRGKHGQKKGRLIWPKVGRRRLNICLLPILKEMSQDHCHYCDRLDIQTPSIDHFVPKCLHPEQSFLWENLYYTCSFCNGEKGSKNIEDVLRPDSVDYCFEKYFNYNFDTGKIEINNLLSDIEYKISEKSIEFYSLNANTNIKARIIYINELTKTNYCGDFKKMLDNISDECESEFSTRHFRFIFDYWKINKELFSEDISNLITRFFNE